MAFKIEYSAVAEADLDAILTWLVEQQAGQAGLRWFEGLQAAVDTLRAFPQRCSLMKKDRRVDFEVRQLFYGKKPHIFRVLFRITGDRVIILRIRRGKQSAARLH
jgi:plasmid stabilization system protein ParE